MAIAVGALYFTGGALAFLKLLPWFGSSEFLLSMVLLLGGVVLVVGGLVARRVLARPEWVPPAAAHTPVELVISAPSEEDEEVAQPFVNPVETETDFGAAEYQPATISPAVPLATATSATSEARADAVYREAVKPLEGSIAFSPATRAPPTPPPAPVPVAMATGPGGDFAARRGGGPTGIPRSDPVWQPKQPSVSPSLPTTRSGAISSATLSSVPAPPSSMTHPLTGRRLCVSCEAILPNDPNVPLCWGCGRALCTSCYWKNGPGPGLHRCPECTARDAQLNATRSGARSGSVTSAGPGSLKVGPASPSARDVRSGR